MPNISVKYHHASLSYFLSGAGRDGRYWRGLTNHSSASAASDQSDAGDGITRSVLGTTEQRSENTMVSRDQGLAVISREGIEGSRLVRADTRQSLLTTMNITSPGPDRLILSLT